MVYLRIAYPPKAMDEPNTSSIRWSELKRPSDIVWSGSCSSA